MNKAILIEYLYKDEMDDAQMIESPRTSYVVYSEPDTELGKEIDHYLESDEYETDFVLLDQVLTKAFGITDDECCFYINDGNGDDEESIKEELLTSNDMVVLNILETIEEEENV